MSCQFCLATHGRGLPGKCQQVLAASPRPIRLLMIRRPGRPRGSSRHSFFSISFSLDACEICSRALSLALCRFWPVLAALGGGRTGTTSYLAQQVQATRSAFRWLGCGRSRGAPRKLLPLDWRRAAAVGQLPWGDARAANAAVRRRHFHLAGAGFNRECRFAQRAPYNGVCVYIVRRGTGQLEVE